MKQKILLLAFTAAILTSCSTAYQAGQTPDDVYYSPARENTGRSVVKQESRNTYQTYTDSEDDNYLRMKIQNRSRWSAIDDFNYWYDPRYSYTYGYNPYNSYSYNPYLLNNWHSPYYGFNPYFSSGGLGFYSPYYPHGYYSGGYGYGGGGYYRPVYVVKNPVKQTNVSRPALGTYRNGNYNNNNSTFGNTMKRVFTPNNNSNIYNNRNSNNSSRSNSYEPPTRSYNPSSSSGSSSSGSSSGGTVTRPPRRGN